MPGRQPVRPAFRVTAADVAHFPPGSTYGPRRMLDFQFVWIIEGDCRYRRDATWVDAPPGSILLCLQGTEDEFVWDPLRRTRHGYFHFSRIPQGVVEALGDPSKLPIRRGPGEVDLLHMLCRHVLSWHDGGDLGIREQIVGAMLLAFATGETAVAQTRPEQLPPAVDRAITLIHDRNRDTPHRPPTFAELVKASGSTGPHLCRLFKRHVGHTPMETVRLVRLHRAASLLTRTTMSVQEIADQLGFATPFHLSRLIKQVYGVSPRRLRQRAETGVYLPGSPLRPPIRPQLLMADMF